MEKKLFYFCKSYQELVNNRPSMSTYFFPRNSVPSFGIGSSAELGMPRNEHFLPRNNGNRSESIPRNFFGTKFRSQPYLHGVVYFWTSGDTGGEHVLYIPKNVWDKVAVNVKNSW